MAKAKPDYGKKAAETKKRTQTQDRLADGEVVRPDSEAEAGASTTDSKESPTAAAKTARSFSPDNENTTQINLRVPAVYRRALKLYAFEHDITFNHLLRGILREWLDRNGLLDG